jgi:ATP-dependent Clp protease ATP-binding subunit ClpA
MDPRSSRTVLRYFLPADTFVRILAHEPREVAVRARPGLNRATYRRLVIEACCPAYAEDFGALAVECPDDPLAAAELLYQLCIEVNPQLDIHTVRLAEPGAPQGQGEPQASAQAGVGEAFERLRRRVRGLEERLKRRVIGQDAAVETVVSAVRRAAAGLAPEHRPIASLLFVGRTGTGKTELARALAAELFPGERRGKLVRIDCSEYGASHEYAKLIGAPPGYVGHESGGVLTEALRKDPDCVVLFDEVEKAHSRLHNLLLQVLEEGQLTDGRGRRVDFRRALVLLTSNTGAVEVRDASRRVGFRSAEALTPDGAAELTSNALEREFAPELLGRLDERVVFRELDLADAERIAERLLAELAERARRSRSAVAFAPALARWVAQRGFRPDCGARELRRVIQREIEAPLASHLLAHPDPTGLVKVALQRGCLRFRAA